MVGLFVALSILANHLLPYSLQFSELPIIKALTFWSYLQAEQPAETALLADLIETKEKLNQFRKSGLKVVLDDFGTGYSSLAYLKDLDIDELKIDKAFVDEIDQKVKHPLVASIVSIGKNLNLKVVAEGVETEEQVNYLKGIGCPVFQGFYYAKPLPEEEFLNFLD